jgi:hypothetical protein
MFALEFCRNTIGPDGFVPEIPTQCMTIALIIVGVAGGEARRSTRNEPDIFSWKIES